MSFLLQESPSDFEMSEFTDAQLPRTISKRGASTGGFVTIVDQQLRVPETGPILKRERLTDLLDRTTTQFAATILSGRAGTGKTTLAADYASLREDAIWYSVGSAQANWEVFSNYFFAALCGRDARRPAKLVSLADDQVTEVIAADLIKRCIARVRANRKSAPSLIVLDDIHYLFDARWFNSFFQQLIVSLPPDVHLLMTCRSKPPAPTWRMRSKQMLTVVEETIFEFAPAEVGELCRMAGLPKSVAPVLFKNAGGRIGRLCELIEAELSLS